MTSRTESSSSANLIKQSLKRRHRSETRFRLYGLAAISIGLIFLVVLFASIIGNGYTALSQTMMQIEVELSADKIDPQKTLDPKVLRAADYGGIVKAALRKDFPDVKKRKQKKALYKLVSSGATETLRNAVLANPDIIGTTQTFWVPADDDVDMLVKGYINRDVVEGDRRVKDFQLVWIDRFESEGRLEKRFNKAFFTNGDSREPELAGIWGAVVGSIYTLLVTLVLSFPIGVAAACYLEEFAPKNRWTDLIEVNINNLAAVPSIVFGLLGLAIFINWAGLPRSAPLVGGLVLSLMTLPTVIIASRAALKSVPPSIREAAQGMGASAMQTVTHHVMPLAMPGMLTGTIIGMARALGETAPLLMIGMVAFVADVPQSPVDPSTALPVQIYLWADSPERAFIERISAAIIVLLVFLMVMNGLAVWLRSRFERRW